MTDLVFLEHPVTHEKMRAPRLGVQVRSATRRHDDGEGDVPGTPCGGVVVFISEKVDPETGEMVTKFDTVEVHRGRVIFDTVEDYDVDWVAYSGGVFPRVLDAIGKALTADAAKGKDPFRHNGTLLALSVGKAAL